LYNSVELVMGAASTRPIVLVLGLDNSGKTAIVNSLRKSGTFKESFMSDVSFRVHKIQSTSLKMTLCDVPGLCCISIVHCA